MKRAIIWFKTDLRLEDNETLIKAIAQSDQVIPVYCFDDAHFETTSFGFKKTGSYRAQFLLESLQDLERNPRALGSGLIGFKCKPEIKNSQKKIVAKHEAKIIIEAHKQRLKGEKDFIEANDMFAIKKFLGYIYLKKGEQAVWDMDYNCARKLFFKSLLTYPFNFLAIKNLIKVIFK